jgi:hypothetical protein
MTMDIRKILVILVIAALFSIFTYSLSEAIFEKPDYDDYCYIDARFPVRDTVGENCTNVEPTETEKELCEEGDLIPQYENGCVVSYKCDTCRQAYEAEMAKFNFGVFLITTILGLVAIIIGLYLPVSKNPLHTWVGTGLMLGGLISIFIGTVRIYGDLHRILKPIIILIELLLVIFITYKKLKDEKK